MERYRKRDRLVNRLEAGGLRYTEKWDVAEVFSLPCEDKRLVAFSVCKNNSCDRLDEVLLILSVFANTEILLHKNPSFYELSSFLAYGQGIDEYLPAGLRDDREVRSVSMVTEKFKNHHMVTVMKRLSQSDLKPGGDNSSTFLVSGERDWEIQEMARDIFSDIREYGQTMGIVIPQVTLIFGYTCSGKMRIRPDFLKSHLFFRQDVEDLLIKYEAEKPENGGPKTFRHTHPYPVGILQETERSRKLLDILIGMRLIDFHREYMGIDVPEPDLLRCIGDGALT